MKLTNRTIEVSENEEVEIETNKIDQPSKEEYNKDKGHLKKEDSNRHKKGSINKNLNGTLNLNTKAIYSKKYQEINRSDEKSFFNNKKIILYKTEMCRSFTEQGYCKYGERCQFSHSGVELRTINRHPKYKTEVCRVFWEQGTCPYGRRCCFVHFKNELHTKIPEEDIKYLKSDKVKENISIDDELPMNEIDTIDNKETKSSLLTLINDKEYKMAREDFYSNNLNRKNYHYFKPEIIKEDIKYKNITQKTNNTIWGEDTSIFNYNDIN